MKRFLIIGFILVLLIAVPIVAFFLINQKTETQSHASPASSLLFEQLTDPAVVGQPYKVTIDVNPSTNGTSNSVSFVKFTVSYDGSKLKADNSSFAASDAFGVILEGPTNSCTPPDNTACTITATLSIGANPANAVSSQTAIGTITFTPLAPTDANAPVKLDFVTGQNQILSLATTDQPAENVFTRGIPTNITVLSVADASGTPVPTTATQSTPSQTNTSGNTSGGTSGNTSGTSNQPPVCNTLTVTKVASDTTGMSYQLTAVGSDSDGTVSKVTFNFGDGNVQDDTNGSTIGTNSINETSSHTYASAGTYTASALLTDNQGAISTSSTCKQTINVGNVASNDNPPPTATAIAQANTPTPTAIPANPKDIPATGPGDTILMIGLSGAALVGLGLFFMFGF